jgi:hypothetical protein
MDLLAELLHAELALRRPGQPVDHLELTHAQPVLHLKLTLQRAGRLVVALREGAPR